MDVDAYAEVLRELYALAGRGIEPGLDRMRAALAAVGHPERSLRVVHVAGTNGKGSVSAMVATGLAAAGQRVGLYTSPHLSSFTERMRVLGGTAIERADVVDGWRAVREPILRVPGVTFFEVITALALWVFRERRVDVAVLEVGLGGALDATNVVDRPLACAITRVGLDHQRYLGPDLASIAAEKAGILKAGVSAVIGPQREEARAVIERVASAVGAPLVHVGRDVVVEDGLAVHGLGHRVEALSPRLRGEHQRENVAVAVGVLFVLDALGVRSDVRAAVETVEWPGRLERIGPYLLDAAHNADGCEALAAHLRSTPQPRRVLVFGAMADKDWRAMIERLRPEVDAIVVTAPPLSRAERPDVLADAIGARAVADPGEALALARSLAGEGGEIVIAGSIYLMGELRARILGIPADPPIAM